MSLLSSEADLRKQKVAEDLERAALLDLYIATPGEIIDALGLKWHEWNGISISVATKYPSILFNRVFGVGLARSVSMRDLVKIKSYYLDNQITRFFLHLYPNAQPATVMFWLKSLGFRKDRGWIKFSRKCGEIVVPEQSLKIKVANKYQGNDFAQIVTEGFGLNPLYRPALAALVSRPNWRIVLAYVNRQAVAAAAMYLKGGMAWLDWAATKPEYQGLGAQTNLLQYRIRLAQRLGCDTVMTATGEDVSHDSQISYHNILKVGLRSDGLRYNYSI